MAAKKGHATAAKEKDHLQEPFYMVCLAVEFGIGWRTKQQNEPADVTQATRPTEERQFEK